MATKTKKPQTATSAKGGANAAKPKVPPAKAAPAKAPKSASTKPRAAKPETTRVDRPTTVRLAKTSAVEPKPKPKPSTAKLARRELRRQRERHDKPGTGRMNRAVSAERVRPEANGHAPERRIAPPADVPVDSLNSPFSAEELAQWRRLLLDQRLEISQDISHLEKDAMEAEDGHTTPNHLAERGSDAEMQDMSLGLAGEEQIVLWQIDRALRKIDNREPIPFGLCEHTKQPIPKMRLQLIPWTPVSIEGMNYVEENGLALEDVLVDG